MECHAAITAWNRAHEKLMTIPPPDVGGQTIHGFTALGDLQAFLVSAGILSDLFFPDPHGKTGQRGQALRDLYQVSSDSPLANKKVRNSFVHIDDRLDKWLTSLPPGPVGPFSISNQDERDQRLENGRYLRVVDTNEWKIAVRGESLILMPLLLEIDRIAHVLPLQVNGPKGLVSIHFDKAH